MSITVEETQIEWSTLIDQLHPGDEVVITRNSKPVARLLAEPAMLPVKRKAGVCKGLARIISEDKDYLQDFKDYME